MTRYLGTAPGGAGNGEAALTISLVEVVIAHRLDKAALPAVCRHLDEILILRPRQLVLDLAECPFIDAAAIGRLLDVHRRLWLTDGLLTLRAPSARLRRILHAARVDHVLHITPAADARNPHDAATVPATPRAAQGV
jgi:anti-anti-sigma factor